MSRLPQITPRQMLAALGRAGFETRRVKGSHHYLVHKDDPTRRTTVAMHSGDPADTRRTRHPQKIKKFSGRIFGTALKDGDGAASIRLYRAIDRKRPHAALEIRRW